MVPSGTSTTVWECLGNAQAVIQKTCSSLDPRIVENLIISIGTDITHAYLIGAREVTEKHQRAASERAWERDDHQMGS